MHYQEVQQELPIAHSTLYLIITLLNIVFSAASFTQMSRSVLAAARCHGLLFEPFVSSSVVSVEVYVDYVALSISLYFSLLWLVHEDLQYKGLDP